MSDESTDCAACGVHIEGDPKHTIHRDDFGVGPEVPLCEPCGGSELPTCEELWERIAERRRVQEQSTRGDMTFTIRCLTGTTQLWSETFSNEPDAAHYYQHKAKLAQQYGPTATAFRFEFLRDGEMVDSFETTEVE